MQLHCSAMKMKMLLFCLPSALASANLAGFEQAPLSETSNAKIKVPGQNYAYYTQTAPENQLFSTLELTPKPGVIVP